MERTRNEALPPRSAYNIVGQVLEGIGEFDFGQFHASALSVEPLIRISPIPSHEIRRSVHRLTPLQR